MIARIMRSSAREFECLVKDTENYIKARALGNILKEGDIVVGDFVEIKECNDNEFEITKVHDRKSEIYRLLVREKRKKVIASNCDLLVVVSSVTKPEYKRGIIDRFLVRAHQWGVTPVIAFTKMDEFNDSFDLSFENNRLKDIPVQCYEISSTDKNYKAHILTNGLVDLKNALKGKTAIFLGQSGVGKSKLITALAGGEIALKSGNIGRSGKGAHTTTWAELVPCGDFSLIDSPGIRSFALDDIPEEDLIGHFPDLAAIAIHCKFNNCNHDEESKGCAFKELDVSKNKEAILSRLESYLKMEEEVQSRAHWDKK